MLFIIIGVVAVILFSIYWRKHFKNPKTGSMIVVDGAVKSGKTTFAMYLAYRIYRRNVRRVKVRNFFAKLLKRELEEMPLFYSSIPVGIPYVQLTTDLLMRKDRFAYKSVIFVDEASLFADSTFCKDSVVNDNLLLFNKLIAHETKGGTIVYNSQSISDLHFSIRRCISEHFYVHDTFRWIPFFLVCTVREERYSEDGVVNAYTGDLEESLRRVIVSKKVWKLFDCYCYSIHTDYLKVNDKVIETVPDLKAREIVSFNPLHRRKVKLEEEVKENEKENS